MNRSIVFSLALASAALPFACKPAGEKSVRQVLPAVNLTTHTLKEEPLMLVEEITATVRARNRATLEARIPGRVLKLAAALGSEAKEGAVLAELDAEEVRTRLDQATATRQQAVQDEKRLSGLLGSGAVSKADYDAVKSRLDVSTAAVREAEAMLAYATVKAPFTGVITRKFADVGDMATPGKPLLEMEDPGQLRVEADVPESLIQGVKMGDELQVSQLSSDPLLAKVAEVAPSADAATRTFPVKLDLPPGSPWRAGQFVRLAIPIREVPSLFVPASAIVSRGQIDAVFVVEEHKARLRLVRLGARIPARGVQILSGLEKGEIIVANPDASLRDGQPVSPP